MDKKLVRSMIIMILMTAFLAGYRTVSCEAATNNSLPDAVLDEGGKSETISVEGNFILDVTMHTEVTDADYNCIYLELPLEDRLLIVCFNNCDGNGQYRWWSDIKTPAGATLIQENCFKDVQANQDISNSDIQVKLRREWNKLTLQAYKKVGESQELFCDYKIEVKGIPDEVKVYFGGENYKISNVAWNVEVLTGDTVNADLDGIGIKPDAAGTNNTLSDVFLDEGQKSEKIVLEGDFALDVTMHTEVTDEKHNCIYLEMDIGEDLLVVCFSHCDGLEDYRFWADIIHPDESRDILSDCFEYVGTTQRIKDEDIRVEFCRIGNKVSLQAKRLGIFGGKTFCDFELELKNVPETVSVYFGGEKVKLSDITWNVGEPSKNGMESVSNAKGVAVFVIMLVIAIIVYLVTVKRIQPALEDAFYVEVPPVLNVLSALGLVYGGIMVTSWFNWPLAQKLVNVINGIYTLLQLSIPSSGTLLGNKIFVIAALVLAVGILVYKLMDEGIMAVFVTLLVGMLKLAALYVIAPVALTSVAALIVSVVMCVVFGIFIEGMAAAGSIPNKSPKEEGFMDLLLNSSNLPEPEALKPEEKVEVWRMNGLCREDLKVSRDGTHYYDPDDGEWHRIKKK